MEGRAAQEKLRSADYVMATAPSNGTEDLVQCSSCGDWGHLVIAFMVRAVGIASFMLPRRSITVVAHGS